MADNIEQHQQNQNQTQPETSTPTPSTTTMAEIEAQPLQQIDTATKKTLPEISFSIWPPTQSTREAIIARLIETLSSPSVLSKRYGTVRPEEASDLSKRIEEEAFSAAVTSASVSATDSAAADDGLEILHVYSKEISKRMLDSVKSRSGSLSTTAASTPAGVPAEEEKKEEDEEPGVEVAAAADGAKTQE